MHVMMHFFFFQAEDGIRDIGVTGVQTCALPISTDTEAATSANGGEPSDELTALKEKAEKARQSVLKAARRYYAAKKSVPIPMSDTKKQMERSIEGRAEFARLKHEESKARDWLLTTIYRMAEAEARVTGRTIVKCLDTYEEFKAAIEK